jgi:Peptidase family M28
MGRRRIPSVVQFSARGGAALPWWVPGVALSDHSSFWRHGYPAVMVTDTAYLRNPYYHTPHDVPATLEYGRMAAVTRGSATSHASLGPGGTSPHQV